MPHDKTMKEASEHARLADEANERAAEKEASAAKLREQADKLSTEAAEERALASRELAAAQAALRDGGIGTNLQPAGGVLRHERTAMDDKQTSSREKGFPWRILAATATTIALLLVLAWLWPFGTKTSAAEKLEVPISGLKADVGALSTKVDGLGSAIKDVDGKLDTLKGEVGALKDCACDKKEPSKTSTRPRTEKPAKPVAVVPPIPAAQQAAPRVPSAHLRQPTHCRWASDGTLRLKEATSFLPANPLKEIPWDTTVETFPKAELKPGETCISWQKKLEAVKADLVPRDRATLNK